MKRRPRTSRTETADEGTTRRFFEGLEYQVERVVATPIARRADYRAHGHGERYLIEVKARGPDLDYYRKLEELGRAGSQDFLGRTNPVSAQIKEAADQLARTDPTDTTVVRLVSLVAAGDLPDVQVKQFESTLYGTVLLARDAEGTDRLPCYYFTFNDFYRFRQIDGALVLSGGRPRLCLNTFGRGVVRLRASRLYQEVVSTGVVTDPEGHEAAGLVLLADTPINRRDEAAVLAHVREKYNWPELQTFKQFWVRVAQRMAGESLGPNGETS